MYTLHALFKLVLGANLPPQSICFTLLPANDSPKDKFPSIENQKVIRAYTKHIFSKIGELPLKYFEIYQERKINLKL